MNISEALSAISGLLKACRHKSNPYKSSSLNSTILNALETTIFLPLSLLLFIKLVMVWGSLLGDGGGGIKAGKTIFFEGVTSRRKAVSALTKTILWQKKDRTLDHNLFWYSFFLQEWIVTIIFLLKILEVKM
ncbi:hypothetical protein GHO42_14435 [Pseudomonas sp. FSL R10-0056]|uniref:hypothetical protein n=1 Tax=unclassified Pseudomonas TaxID=196821 RepID=UPI001296F156|nr:MULTISPECIES: hypothetical protein [unclassified Pseudomonas]MQT64276.1 hypothetical protein [Pseudomonas sp. FSL R10-0056]MQT69975.1 hypothetical protein [Pseudomonas sp. FSL R10-0071]MQU48700.1 hypothetical protein [Pseudomonas sp. FSL A6-1183]